jgi:hypothetical protein
MAFSSEEEPVFLCIEEWSCLAPRVMFAVSPMSAPNKKPLPVSQEGRSRTHEEGEGGGEVRARQQNLLVLVIVSRAVRAHRSLKSQFVGGRTLVLGRFSSGVPSVNRCFCCSFIAATMCGIVME